MVASNNGINNTVGASISGVANTLTITNPSNTASSAARETIVVGGGTASDPTINWNVTGVTNWEAGIDNSDSDKWKLSQGTALGTNDTITCFTTGQVLKPRQPAFRAYLSANAVNVTGDGTNYPMVWDTEVFDIGNNYNNATGIFTAPVTGIYYFYASVFGAAFTIAFTSFDISFLVNGVVNSRLKVNPSASTQTGTCLPAMISLTSGDQVNATVQVGVGTKTIIIIGSSLDTLFEGYLVC